MVPVTTKPYFKSDNFIIFQQGFPAFFLIKKKTNQHFTSCLQDCSTYELPCILVSECFDHGSRFPANYVGGIVLLALRDLHLIRSQRDSRSLRFGDNSTNASNYTSFVSSESHLKEDFYNGKSSGI
jgi:hypothetical protein